LYNELLGTKKIIWLAVTGALIPYLFFQFIKTNGIDIPNFITSLFINRAAGGFREPLIN